VLEDDMNEYLLFCKATNDRATSLEVFSIISHCLEESELHWENCAGFCTDGSQSTPGINAGIQALVRKPLTLSGQFVSFTECRLFLKIWVRSYRLYFKLLSDLLTMSKTVHWEEDSLQIYVAV